MALVDEVLERQLVEAVRDARLEVEDVVAVVEGLGRVPVGQSAGKLIQDGKAEPDQELAAEISANAPTATRHVRLAALQGAELPLAEGLALEAEMMAAQRTTEDSREGVAAFIEKREPVWPGR